MFAIEKSLLLHAKFMIRWNNHKELIQVDSVCEIGYTANIFADKARVNCHFLALHLFNHKWLLNFLRVKNFFFN